MTEFEEGEHYEIDELPENETNKSGKLEWVGDETLALVTNDGQMVEFWWSHVECTDVKYVDRDTGGIHDTRGEAGHDD